MLAACDVALGVHSWTCPLCPCLSFPSRKGISTKCSLSFILLVPLHGLGVDHDLFPGQGPSPPPVHPLLTALQCPPPAPQPLLASLQTVQPPPPSAFETFAPCVTTWVRLALGHHLNGLSTPGAQVPVSARDTESQRGADSCPRSPSPR